MSGYVYLIGTPIFGWYKIGKSIQPTVRVSQLGILLPFKISVIAVWSATNHHLMEKTLHEIHAANRINGEWFEFSKSEVFKIIDSIPAESMVDKLNLENFSNVAKDVKLEKRIIGVRTENLRGNFTPEERAAKRDIAIEQHRLKKERRIQVDNG